MKHSIFTILFLSISALLLHGALAEQSGIQAGAEQCGIQAGGALCHNNLCCSKWGFCGNTAPYCDDGCQSQCPSPPSPPPPSPPPPSPSPPPPPPSPPPPSPSPPPPPPLPPSPPSPSGGGVASIISSAVFDQLLMHRNDPTCPARGFYRYEDFIVAANKFVGFGTTGDLITRKREIAAFLAQTSHQTRGKQWVRAPDGRYTWGYCIVEEVAPTSDYCVPSVELPCVPGRKYYGRGPIQLTSNYDYAQAGKYLGLDLLRDPDLVATNRTISFETALWFWMTPQTPTPSCHDVITDNWIPSDLDQLFGRLPGYGVITNIINGRLECWRGHNRNVLIRIGFYKRYCDILGVSVGDYLDCFNQMPFNWPRLSARAEE